MKLLKMVKMLYTWCGFLARKSCHFYSLYEFELRVDWADWARIKLKSSQHFGQLHYLLKLEDASSLNIFKMQLYKAIRTQNRYAHSMK